jgi:preprotein translocase subunit SecG
MRHVAWLLITLFTAVTILTACSSSREYQHNHDKTKTRADDAHRDMERQEQQQP